MAIAIKDQVQAPPADALVQYSRLCPHMGGPLDQGRIANGEVICPWHRYRFDLGTGEGRGMARVLGLCLARRGEEARR